MKLSSFLMIFCFYLSCFFSPIDSSGSLIEKRICQNTHHFMAGVQQKNVSTYSFLRPFVFFPSIAVSGWFFWRYVWPRLSFFRSQENFVKPVLLDESDPVPVNKKFEIDPFNTFPRKKVPSSSPLFLPKNPISSALKEVSFDRITEKPLQWNDPFCFRNALLQVLLTADGVAPLFLRTLKSVPNQEDPVIKSLLAIQSDTSSIINIDAEDSVYSHLAKELKFGNIFNVAEDPVSLFATISSSEGPLKKVFAGMFSYRLKDKRFQTSLSISDFVEKAERAKKEEAVPFDQIISSENKQKVVNSGSLYARYWVTHMLDNPIASLPNVFVINLLLEDRFPFTHMNKIPAELFMRDMNNEEVIYELVALVNYGSFHYTASIRLGGKWWEYDDYNRIKLGSRVAFDAYYSEEHSAFLMQNRPFRNSGTGFLTHKGPYWVKNMGDSLARVPHMLFYAKKN